MFQITKKGNKTKKLQGWLFVLGFLGRFILFAFPFYIVLALEFDFRPVQVFLASAVAWFSNLFGIVSVSDGYLIRSGDVIIEVVDACVGWKDIVVFSAMVLAVPKINWKNRFVGLFGGSLIIFSLNFLRLFATLLVALWKPNFLFFFHELVWKFGMVVLVLAVWVGWLEIIK